jgi:putative methylase
MKSKMKKKELEMILQKIPNIPKPSPTLEQYNTPASVAADILFNAYQDIANKKVADLGCGTGIFSIGAKMLGAKNVVGIDIDEKAVNAAKECSGKRGLKIDYRVMDVKDFDEKCDTVIQNPPFGAQTRHADRIFLQKALEIGSVVYTLHLSKTADFVRKFVDNLGGRVIFEKKYKFQIKHIFNFHKKKKAEFDVILLKVMVIK